MLMVLVINREPFEARLECLDIHICCALQERSCNECEA